MQLGLVVGDELEEIRRTRDGRFEADGSTSARTWKKTKEELSIVATLDCLQKEKSWRRRAGVGVRDAGC